MIISQYTFDPCSYQKDYFISIINLNCEKRDSFFDAILMKDQSFRHQIANKDIDLKNLLELAVLLQIYGHPSRETSNGAYNIPTLACRHNPYIYTRHFYDIFKKSYNENILDDETYYSYLETQYLGKFGYLYIKSNRNENIKESILLMQDRLKLDAKYPLSEICNAYNMQFLSYKHQTDSLPVIGKYQNETIVGGIDSIIVHDLGSDKLLMTTFKGYGINTYEMIKVEGKDEVYKFNSDYNPKILSIGQKHIYLIDPNSRNKYTQTFNKIKNDTDNK